MTYDDRLHRGCDEFLPHLSELISDTASEELSSSWEEHRMLCGECHEQWKHVQTLMSAWSQMPLKADPRSSWSGIKRELDQDCDALAASLGPVFQEYRELPSQISKDRVWKRIRKQSKPSARWSWARALDFSALTVAGGWVFCLLIKGNDAALNLAIRWLPESDLLTNLAATPWSILFLPVSFALFGSSVSIASLPLLKRAAQQETSLIAMDSGNAVRSGGVA